MNNKSNNFVLKSYELVWYKGIHEIVMNPKLTYAYCLPLSKYFLFVQTLSFNPTNCPSSKVVSAYYSNNVFTKLKIWTHKYKNFFNAWKTKFVYFVKRSSFLMQRYPYFIF